MKIARKRPCTNRMYGKVFPLQKGDTVQRVLEAKVVVNRDHTFDYASR